MRFLLIGANGQVGWELKHSLAPLGEVVALYRRDLDMTDAGKIRECVTRVAPDVIVNAAAYTAVDRAESEPDLSMSVNGTAPGVLAEEAKRRRVLLVHYSTDYVFDGAKAEPYVEEDAPNPQNVYGKTKLAGEEAIRSVNCNHLIFRTSWVYGTRGGNFFLTIRRLAREREELRVVDDQIGAPTWSRTIAESTAAVLAQGFNRSEGFFGFFDARKGVYHLTAGGRTSWFGFAQRIVESVPENERKVQRILPIRTKDYPCKALRPLNSVLNNGKLEKCFGIAQTPWDACIPE